LVLIGRKEKKIAVRVAPAAGAAGESAARDEVEHEIRGACAEAPDALTAFATEHRLEFGGIVLEAGDDLPAVAPGSAPARRFGVDDDHVGAGFGEMQRGGQPQIARADDQHVGTMRTFQRGHRRRGNGGLLPDVGVPHRGQ